MEEFRGEFKLKLLFEFRISVLSFKNVSFEKALNAFIGDYGLVYIY